MSAVVDAQLALLLSSMGEALFSRGSDDMLSPAIDQLVEMLRDFQHQIDSPSGVSARGRVTVGSGKKAMEAAYSVVNKKRQEREKQKRSESSSSPSAATLWKTAAGSVATLLAGVAIGAELTRDENTVDPHGNKRRKTYETSIGANMHAKSPVDTGNTPLLTHVQTETRINADGSSSEVKTGLKLQMTDIPDAVKKFLLQKFTKGVFTLSDFNALQDSFNRAHNPDQ